MAERGGFSRGASRGGPRSDRGGRGGFRGGRGGAATEPGERPKRENILDLSKYMHKRISVKFSGGREIHGELVGYDQLMNMVLDEVQEIGLGELDENGEPPKRYIGLTIVRGTMLMTLSPLEGAENIDNPFYEGEEE